MTKYASVEILDARLARSGAGLVRDAHRHEFQYDPRPGFLYVRSRAISSRTNDNYDHFPAAEIKKAYRTFIGKPVFVNHHNENHRTARGVIVDAALHEDTNPDGSPDTWAEVLMEVDAVHFPILAKAILAGHIDRTSMGTDVQFSVCSVCNNRAETPLDYCFPPGELVTMADGTLRPIEQVREGDLVLTHDGAGRVTALMERDYAGDLAVIHRTAYARPLRVTHGHEVLTNLAGRRDESKSGDARYASVHASENWAWTPSQMLEPGNWMQGAYPVAEETHTQAVADLAPDFAEVDGRAVLASPYRTGSHVGSVQYGKHGLPATVDNTDLALAFVLGLYAAEGSLESAKTAAGTPKCLQWSLGAHETDLVHDLQMALDKLGAGQVKVYARPDSAGIAVRLSNAPLAALATAWVGSGASNKHLSGEVMLAPAAFQRVFLDAYHRGDGWDDPRGHVEVRTAGGLLARQMVMLGSRADSMVPSWWENTNNSGGPGHRDRRFTIHHVSMGHNGAMKGRRHLTDGYFANRVVRTETEHYHGPVFNIEVEGQHSYVAEGVVVHNCDHIPKLKGKKIRRTTASGGKEDVLVYEKCFGLGFFENSLLVEEPADPTAVFLGVDSRGLQSTASKSLSSIKIAMPVCLFDGEPLETEEERAEHESQGHPVIEMDWLDSRYSPQVRNRAASKTALFEDRYDDPEMGAVYRKHDEMEAALQAAVARKRNWKVDPLGMGGVRHAGGLVRIDTELLMGYRVHIQRREDGPWDWYGDNVQTPEAAFRLGDRAYKEAIRTFFEAASRTAAYPNLMDNMKDAPAMRKVRFDAAFAEAKAALAAMESGDISPQAVARAEAAIATLTRAAEETQMLGAIKSLRTALEVRLLGQSRPIFGSRTSSRDWAEAGRRDMASGGERLVLMTYEDLQREGSYDESEEYLRGAGLSGAFGSHRTALGETVAPAQVDTLRDESCPVCGENDSYDGDKCLVCNFIRPPDEFLDPDLEKAKQVDLRQDQTQEDAVATQDGAADPNQAPGDPLQEGANPSQPWLNKTKPAEGAEDAAVVDPAAGKPWEQKTKPANPEDSAEATEVADEEGSTQPWKSRTKKKKASVGGNHVIHA